MALKIEHLTGGYTGVPVIKDINLEIKPGQALGLIGLNGAGKSTTIKHILGLLRPQKGTISLNGVVLRQQPTKFKQEVAYIPETPVLYPELTLKEHLELTMLSYNLDEEKAWKRAHELLKMFRLDDKLEWLPIHFSKGMRQKVMIMSAFLVNPALYIIDEPFVGLDPLGIKSLLDQMEQQKKKGASVLMSTHILSTAERYCDRIILLHNGRIRAMGTMADLRKAFNMPDASLDDLYIAMTEDAVNEELA